MPVSMRSVMSKKLVAYFSATGTTAKLSEKLSEAIDADLFAIEPKVPYTNADLNWMDKNSRSTIEMKDPSSRPEIASKRDNLADYDVIFVGFPIWWYVAPTIVYTHTTKFGIIKSLSSQRRRILRGRRPPGVVLLSKIPKLTDDLVCYESKLVKTKQISLASQAMPS